MVRLPHRLLFDKHHHVYGDYYDCPAESRKSDDFASDDGALQSWSRLHGHRLERRILAALGGGIISPLPGELAANYGPCDMIFATTSTAQYLYVLVKTRTRMLGYGQRLASSGTTFWQSGSPFSGLSASYALNGDGIVQGCHQVWQRSFRGAATVRQAIAGGSTRFS
jgi:hypothetical protein